MSEFGQVISTKIKRFDKKQPKKVEEIQPVQVAIEEKKQDPAEVEKKVPPMQKCYAYIQFEDTKSAIECLNAFTDGKLKEKLGEDVSIEKFVDQTKRSKNKYQLFLKNYIPKFDKDKLKDEAYIQDIKQKILDKHTKIFQKLCEPSQAKSFYVAYNEPHKNFYLIVDFDNENDLNNCLNKIK